MGQIVKVYKDGIGYQVLNTDNIGAALEAGDNISINGNEISAVDTTYSAGTGLSLSGTTFSLNVDYGADLSLSIDPSTFVLTAQLKNQNGGNIGSAQTIDLPLESVVVSGSYNSQTKEVELTLQSGSVIRFSVADLVSGLQEELIEGNGINIDNNNEISVDTSVIATKEYVDDSIAESVSAGPTAPLNPTQGMLRYDTVNDVLKSYDGTNWNEVGNESVDINTKTFRLSGTSDLTNAQAAYDWFSAGKNPIIMYNNRAYLLYSNSASQLIFQDIENSAHDQLSYTEYVGQKIIFTLSGNNVTAITYNSTSGWSGPILRTDVDYSTPYTPTYAGSPTTKQYVDDSIAESISSGATAPSNPTEGQIWYDTTNDILKVYDGTNWTAVDTDTTYSAGTGISIDNNNEISADTSVIATKEYVDDSIDGSISSGPTPPSNPTEGQLWYDTTNDVLKVYDGTNFVATGKTYTAGSHIEISNADVISTTGLQEELTAGNNITIQNECVTEDNKKGPCPSGFHVPTYNECTNLINAGITIGAWGSGGGDDFRDKMKMPYSGYRSGPNSANIVNRNYMGFVWTCDGYTIGDPRSGYCLLIGSGNLRTSGDYRQDLLNIRPFKNTGVAPDSSWTTIYDGSSTATGAGIFHNAGLGLISISTDGTTWTTIADKNLGATTVYSVGDTLSEANCGKYYQWGNNYGFQWDGNITNTSSTPIDGSSYGPNNYYYNETLVRDTTRTFYDWSTVRNDNVWGGTSQGTFQDCSLTISATGVQPGDLGTAAYCNTGTSSGDVPVLDSGGKLDTSILPGVTLTDTFTVTNASDLTGLTTAQQGDIGIVTSESKTYVLSANPYSTASNWKELLVPTSGVTSVNSKTGAVILDADDIDDTNTTHKFVTANDITNLGNLSGTNTGDQTASDFDIKDLTDSTGLRTTWSGKQNALTAGNYIDITNNVISNTQPGPTVSANQPSIANEGDIWYDTTNDILKVYDGTNWNTVNTDTTYSAGTGISIDANNEISNTQPGPTVSANQPSTASEGDLWYDTTNDVLKVYDGTNWNIVGDDTALVNTKTFYLASDQDTTTAMAIGDYYLSGGQPLVVYDNHLYSIQAINNGRDDDVLRMYLQSTPYAFTNTSNGSVGDYETWTLGDVSGIVIDFRSITYDAQHNPTSFGTVHSIDIGNGNIFTNYTTLNTAQTITGTKTFTISPIVPSKTTDATNTGTAIATEAQVYSVDNKTTKISSTAPSSPTEGMLWYDTTNDVLKSYDGTNWNKTGTQMKVLSYGSSTWQDFLDAYNENAVVYCKASSNSDPGTGVQGRMAFMAFVNISGSTPTSVEFQYYRSRSDHNSAANQLDQVFVYKLENTNGGTWSVIERNTAAKATAGTGISLSYGSGNMTISADTSVLATKQDIADLGSFEVVASLPSVSDADTKTIYLLGPIGTGADKYEEWIVTEDSQQQKQWTKIGETSMDLSGYATTSDLSSGLATKQDTLTTGTGINITNDTISVDNTIAKAADAGNVRRFENTTASLQAMYDWLYNSTGRYGIVQYNNRQDYIFGSTSATDGRVYSAEGYKVVNLYYSGKKLLLDKYNIYYTLNSGSVSGTLGYVSSGAFVGQDVAFASDVLTKTNTTSFTPTADYHPATKKYVDDSLSSTMSSGTTAPANPTEGQLWYDTTNDVLKVYDGTNWNEVNTDTTYSAGAGISINQNNEISNTLPGPTVSASQPSTASEGDLWYDTTNDVLKAYDGTNWNATGATYTAGTGISISSNAIANTGVLSVNGQTGNVTVADIYSDYAWVAKSGTTIELSINSTLTPTADFTINAPAQIKDGQIYILRITNGGAVYNMTLGTNITNPFATDLTLTRNGIDQFVFMAIGGNLELQPEAN